MNQNKKQLLLRAAIFIFAVIVGVLVLRSGDWLSGEDENSTSQETSIQETSVQETSVQESSIQESSTEPIDNDSAVESSSSDTIQESSTEDSEQAEKETSEDESGKIREDEWYYSTEDVAEYLFLYGHLPDNYLTKEEAKALGWDSKQGNLWEVTDYGCIGGDRFGNYEELLPTKKGRTYYECDVNYEGGYRGDDRIIYSDDGLIYFTEDHYEHFELLYGEP